MKGFIYKEWCLCKKSWITFAVLTGLFVCLGYLVALSMEVGNLRSFVQNDPEEAGLLLMIFIYMPLFLGLSKASLSINNVQSDFKTGWGSFAYTLPGGVRKSVAAKYILMGLFVVGEIAFALINGWILCGISFVDFDVDIIKNIMAILLVMLLLPMIEMPFFYLFKGTQNVQNVIICIMMALCFSIEFAMINAKMNEERMVQILEKLVEVRDVLWIFVPIIVIAAMVLSYAVTVKIYDRRAK